jgi:tetratricopeptide (TPR) repeat protein
MDWYPDLTSEAKCREFLERYPENVYVKFRLASLLRAQAREEEAGQILALDDAMHSLKYDMGLLNHNESIRHTPNDPVARLNRGIWQHGHGSYEAALSDYDRAILLNPRVAYDFCSRASLRATCPDNAFRDGRLAIDDARVALNLAEQAGELFGDWRHRLYLQVLAAAYAANNQFRRAIALQSRALDLALTKTARSIISKRLEQYRTGNPIRDKTGLVGCGFNPSDQPG